MSTAKGLVDIHDQHRESDWSSFGALQTSWAQYARAKLGAEIERGVRKKITGREHLTPDEYKASVRRESELVAELDAARSDRRAARAERQAAEAERQSVRAERAAVRQLASSSGVAAQRQREQALRNELDAKEEQLTALRAEVSRLTSALENTERDKVELTAELGDARKAAAALRKHLRYERRILRRGGPQGVGQR